MIFTEPGKVILVQPCNAISIAVPRVNAAPAGYEISAGARASLAETFRLEYDLYHFLKQRLLGQVTEVCTVTRSIFYKGQSMRDSQVRD